jgi:GT2 family glycosyltransferase
MDVSIIIVNYNTHDDLRKCLNSILVHTKEIEYEIIVVDNNSPNRAVENLPSRYPTIQFHFRKVNDGFGSGCNYGARVSRGKYLLFVNPDVIFKDNVVRRFVQFLDSQSGAVMCTGLFEDESGGLGCSFNKFPNIRWDMEEAFTIGYKRHFVNLLSTKEIKKNEAFEIDHPLGALMFVRRDAFFVVNGFDERFFLYNEDVDIGYRLRQMGKRIYCLPWVRVFHRLNSSLDGFEGRTLQTFHLCRSKMIYMYKHYDFFQRILTRLIVILGMILRLAYAPFNIRYKSKKIQNFKRIFSALKIVIWLDINKVGKYYN